jgi:hypothetical protein
MSAHFQATPIVSVHLIVHSLSLADKAWIWPRPFVKLVRLYLPNPRWHGLPSLCEHVWSVCFPAYRQSLLNESGAVEGSGRTGVCKHPSGVWNAHNLVTLPADSDHVRSCMLLVQVFGEAPEMRLLSETMIWMRDILDHVRSVHARSEKAQHSSALFSMDQVWDTYTPSTEELHSQLHALVEFYPLEVRVSPSHRGLTSVSRPAKQHVAGTFLVRLLSGSNLRDRELVGKQDPYVIFMLKHHQHPLNVAQSGSGPQV